MRAILAVIFAIGAYAQTKPAFEVASIRPSDPNERGRCAQYLPGGRFVSLGCQIPFVIQLLYGLRNFQILNAPAWAHGGFDSFYTIQAKASEPVGNDQLKLMAQNLLADRFKLRFHRETQDMNVYAMIVGKDGPKLQPAKENGQPRGSGGIASYEPGRLRVTNSTMSNVAMALSGPFMDRPVVDKTGLTDVVDFTLQWSPEGSGDTTHPSVFTAIQEQLGLKLESRKLPIEVLVIDRLERPTEN